jgi:hypothetical protein
LEIGLHGYRPIHKGVFLLNDLLPQAKRRILSPALG